MCSTAIAPRMSAMLILLLIRYIVLDCAAIQLEHAAVAKGLVSPNTKP
jgi:hypothetical protein